MEVNEENFNLTLADGTKELVIRHGDAPANPAMPLRISLSGTIASVTDFATKRKDTIDPAHSHVVLDDEKSTVQLVINERDEYGKTVVNGTLKHNTEFEGLGINTSKRYSVSSLRDLWKKSRHLFESRDKQAEILGALTAFESKVEVNFKDANDYKGNTAYEKVTKCTSNLPLAFELRLQVFKGFPKTTIKVETEILVNDGQLYANLVSYDLMDYITDTREKAFEELLKEVGEIPVIRL